MDNLKLEIKSVDIQDFTQAGSIVTVKTAKVYIDFKVPPLNLEEFFNWIGNGKGPTINRGYNSFTVPVGSDNELFFETNLRSNLSYNSFTQDSDTFSEIRQENFLSDLQFAKQYNSKKQYTKGLDEWTQFPGRNYAQSIETINPSTFESLDVEFYFKKYFFHILGGVFQNHWNNITFDFDPSGFQYIDPNTNAIRVESFDRFKFLAIYTHSNVKPRPNSPIKSIDLNPILEDKKVAIVSNTNSNTPKYKSWARNQNYYFNSPVGTQTSNVQYNRYIKESIYSPISDQIVTTWKTRPVGAKLYRPIAFSGSTVTGVEILSGPTFPINPEDLNLLEQRNYEDTLKFKPATVRIEDWGSSSNITLQTNFYSTGSSNLAEIYLLFPEPPFPSWAVSVFASVRVSFSYRSLTTSGHGNTQFYTGMFTWNSSTDTKPKVRTDYVNIGNSFVANNDYFGLYSRLNNEYLPEVLIEDKKLGYSFTTPDDLTTWERIKTRPT